MEENDLILCTVERIQGTTVFVKIEDTDKEGTLVTSEISPGRIRNLRDYVVPGKKIVCKILKISGKNIHLSLRRVLDKEKREILDKYKKEKSYQRVISSIVKENSEEIIKKIKTEHKSIYDFFQLCKGDTKKLESYFTKDEIQKLCKILEEKKEKGVEIKKEFSLKSNKENGLTIIKDILSYSDNILYLAAGRFVIKIKSEDYKKANKEMEEILENIKKKSESQKAEFIVKEK
ncbi:MAG: hypothetical protein ABIG37_03565 [Nanoarchaeota archaeon]|nr:hypothetical protein [Nanoarchaeota archaeon]